MIIHDILIEVSIEIETKCGKTLLISTSLIKKVLSSIDNAEFIQSILNNRCIQVNKTYGRILAYYIVYPSVVASFIINLVEANELKFTPYEISLIEKYLNE